MAQRLTVLAFEQPTKPATRGGFPAARGIVKTLLAAGHTPQAVANVIREGGIVWTLAGVELKLTQQARPTTSAYDRSAWLRRPGTIPLDQAIRNAVNGTPTTLALTEGDHP